MLTVLTFDLAGRRSAAATRSSVVADGDTVYANGPSLYIVERPALADARRHGAQDRSPRRRPSR